MFRPVKHSSSITDRLACSYPAYECSGQRVEGYEYCIRHILEDKSAPYRPCGYVYSGNGRRCVMPTPKADKRETGYIFLEAHCSIGWPQGSQSAMKEETTAVDCRQGCLHWATPPYHQGEQAGKGGLWLPCRVSVLQKVLPSQWNQPKETDISYCLGLLPVSGNAVLQSKALS
jgi:hypothetical protein